MHGGTGLAFALEYMYYTSERLMLLAFLMAPSANAKTCMIGSDSPLLKYEFVL